MSPSATRDATAHAAAAAAAVTEETVKTKDDQQEQQQQHVHGGEGLTSRQALSHGPVTIPGIPSFTSHERKRQWQLEHMAGVFRVWARHGYTEGLSGHISVRDPEFPNCIWMNPLGVHFGLLRASDMVLVCMDDGSVVMTGSSSSSSSSSTRPSRPANAAGFLIHTAVHAARPDVHAVCHAHTPHGKAWSAFARPLDMLNQDVCKLYKAHSVYASYGGVVLAAEEGEIIARALGAHNKACLLMNHGLLTVGGTVDEAAYLFGLMERSCQVQLQVEAAAAAAATGGKLEKVLIPDEEAAYNFKVESEPELLYCEFQPDYEYEDAMCNGAFKS